MPVLAALLLTLCAGVTYAAPESDALAGLTGEWAVRHKCKGEGNKSYPITITLRGGNGVYTAMAQPAHGLGQIALKPAFEKDVYAMEVTTPFGPLALALEASEQGRVLRIIRGKAGAALVVNAEGEVRLAAGRKSGRFTVKVTTPLGAQDCSGPVKKKASRGL